MSLVVFLKNLITDEDDGDNKIYQIRSLIHINIFEKQ